VGSDFIPKKSNINLLVVVKEIHLNSLRKCFRLVQEGKKRGIVVPLFLTKWHMESSVDVFPIEFIDMKEGHLVIYGEDVFKELKIGEENLRLECEEQLKGKLIRLRQVYLETGGKKREIERIAIQALNSFIPVFKGILKLLGKEIPNTKRKVIDLISEETNIERKVFHQVLNIKEGKARLSPQEIEEFYETYLQEIEKLAMFVDQLNVK
jgi:hypothetical protein